MSGKICFDDFHINIRGMTGSDITKLFIKLTLGSKWKESNIKYSFYDVDKTSGSNEIPDPEKFCFTIKPNKTTNQPYNGVIEFKGVKSSQTTWELLKVYLKHNTFRKFYRDYLDNKVDSKNFKLHENIACVLLSFEIARREKELSGDYPITRRMTSDAINEVFFSDATAEEHKDKVDSLVKMFRSGKAKNKYKGRKEGYDEIMNYSTRQTPSDPNVVELSRKLATTTFFWGGNSLLR